MKTFVTQLIILCILILTNETLLAQPKCKAEVFSKKFGSESFKLPASKQFTLPIRSKEFKCFSTPIKKESSNFSQEVCCAKKSDVKTKYCIAASVTTMGKMQKGDFASMEIKKDKKRDLLIELQCNG